MREAVTKDGWRGLYRGLSPNVAGNASSWGLYFLLCVFSRASSEEGRVTVRRTK
jgi:hypothetical protein